MNLFDKYTIEAIRSKRSKIESKLKLDKLISAVMTALPIFAFTVYLSLIPPDPVYFESIFVLEFLTLHSGIFIGQIGIKKEAAVTKHKTFFALFVFYGLFAFSAAMVSGAIYVLYTYIFVMASRYVSIVLVIRRNDADGLTNKSFIGAIIWLLAAFLLVIFVELFHMKGVLAYHMALIIYFFFLGLLEFCQTYECRKQRASEWLPK